MTDKTIADVLDKSIDRLSAGAAEIAKAAKQVAPHAWEVAVRQQVIEGRVHAIAPAITLAFVIGVIIWYARSAKALLRFAVAHEKAEYPSLYKDKEPLGMLFYIISACGLIVALTVFGASLHSLLDASLKIANPEYYAAKTILEAVK